MQVILNSYNYVYVENIREYLRARAALQVHLWLYYFNKPLKRETKFSERAALIGCFPILILTCRFG